MNRSAVEENKNVVSLLVVRIWKAEDQAGSHISQ